MSTTDPTRSPSTVQQYPGAGGSEAYGYPSDDTVSGWVTFAGVMLMILATVNVIQGIAAVSSSTFFTENAKFVISGLNTWGWILILCGIGQALVAWGVLAQAKGVRWIGVRVSSRCRSRRTLFMPAYPFWSLCLFTLDILVIYGLIAHGKRAEA